jgi:Kef-type K+ transport system membrane component KefB
LILGGGALITVVMLSGVRLLLRRYLRGTLVASPLDGRTLAFTLALVMLSAWATTTTNLHPAFGAFLLGVAVPRNQLTSQIQARISPVTVNLLLPIFFIYAGLNTRIGLVNTPRLVVLALLVIAVACLSKGVACWLAATVAGYRQRDALAIGILMNARGLVELIILTAALDNRIITPTLFSIMVVMTIVTTLMAAPVLRLLYKPVRTSGGPLGEPSTLVSPSDAGAEDGLGRDRPADWGLR